MGIESMLSHSSQNDELQQYLNEKAYETASLGETSADELTQVPSSSSSAIVYYRDADSSLDNRKELAQQISNYEAALVRDHLGLDLYRSKNKSKTQISFNDLTLSE